MNKYEQKQADRKAYYEAKAAETASESERTHKRARDLGSAIPFGQPILVGHHSERRDRNFRKRIEKTHRKGAELQQKSEYYAQKAASVGTGGISSDDPDAVSKLKEKLTQLEAHQTLMKTANRIVRSKKTSDQEKIAGLAELGVSDPIQEPATARSQFGVKMLVGESPSIDPPLPLSRGAFPGLSRRDEPGKVFLASGPIGARYALPKSAAT